MFDKVGMDQFVKSHDAIRKYIHSGQDRFDKWGIHEDIVTVLKDDEIDIKESMQVSSVIETNESYIDILWPSKYENRFWGRYSNRYQPFRYENGILIIDWKEKNGEKITIMIG